MRMHTKMLISVSTQLNFIKYFVQSTVNTLLEQYTSVRQLICAVMSELEGEKRQNSSPLQTNFISTNYANNFTLCETARQYESKSLEITKIEQLGAEI